MEPEDPRCAAQGLFGEVAVELIRTRGDFVLPEVPQQQLHALCRRLEFQLRLALSPMDEGGAALPRTLRPRA